MDENTSAEDPQENPTNTDHLPVSGEVGNGPVSDHDPLTQDTTDGDIGSTDNDLQDVSLELEPNEINIDENIGAS